MTVVIIAVTVLGVLVLVDLVLTLGVVKRLRTHAALIEQALSTTDPMPPIMAPRGAKVAPFEARTVDGKTVSLSDLLDPTLVGFFSTDCPACGENLPAFLDRARVLGRDRVLAVAHGATDEVADLVAKLGAVARVVTEAPDGPLGRAFSVRGVPALCLVDPAGTVVASASEMAGLPTPADVSRT
ncbi:TlpA disulfide reductase family protein [Kibdelosporangium aridum]|uniref:Peroxiredoxin n=1 Tax=Kibdelosporangium aridum TaxID=2030 RepID=A0A1Y5Y9U2_KIBAR|nr:TlpA disulfide reductase family protein [Kibdelosporangium aridum]SMD26905.1 Peroxiredoxin [Kibdelosporangium aridum]